MWRQRYSVFMVWLSLIIFPFLFTSCAGLSPQSSDEEEYEETEISMEPMPQLKAPYKGKTIVVASFAKKRLYSTYYWLQGWLGSASTDYAVEFLLDSGFDVVEGQSGQLNALIDEIDLGESGMIESSQAVEIGKLSGAELIYVGSITDYVQSDNKKKDRLCLPGVGCARLGGSEQRFEVETSGRIIDIKTRKILASSTASFKKKYKSGSTSISMAGGPSVGSDEQTRARREGSGKIFKKALNSLTIKLVNKLNARARVGGGFPPVGIKP